MVTGLSKRVSCNWALAEIAARRMASSESRVVSAPAPVPTSRQDTLALRVPPAGPKRELGHCDTCSA